MNLVFLYVRRSIFIWKAEVKQYLDMCLQHHATYSFFRSIFVSRCRNYRLWQWFHCDKYIYVHFNFLKLWVERWIWITYWIPSGKPIWKILQEQSSIIHISRKLFIQEFKVRYKEVNIWFKKAIFTYIHNSIPSIGIPVFV